MKLRSGTWIQEKDASGRLAYDHTLLRCVLERVDNPSDLTACMQVCKTWRSIAFEPYLWINMAKRFENVDITELMRVSLEKKRNLPIPDFHTTRMIDEESKRRLMTNRLLLLTKESHEFARAHAGSDIALRDLVFTMDILLDGVLQSSVCFERAHANSINKLNVNLPVEEVLVDWNCPTSKMYSSITQRGISLLHAISEKLEVKINIMRSSDLKMTQVFSYDTTECSKFNWDLSWDTADDVSFALDAGDWTNKDEWTLWLYSNHSDSSKKRPRNSFHIADSAFIFNEVDDTSSSESSDLPFTVHDGHHFLLCDIKLQLHMTQTERGFIIEVDHALVMVRPNRNNFNSNFFNPDKSQCALTSTLPSTFHRNSFITGRP